MTPEELDNKIEFIIGSLARVAASQEHTQEILERMEREREEDRTWSKNMMSRVVELIDLQSRRLDRHEQFHRDFLKQAQETQARTDAFQSQALHLLNLLLDRLPPPATL